MKTSFLASLALAGLFLAPALVRAQNGNSGLTSNGPAQGNGVFAIRAITATIRNTPEFTTLGGETQSKRYTLGKWLEIEVEFSSSAPAAEVQVKYNVLIAGKLLTGEQTLVDVPASPAGQGLFTVAYISPRTLSTLLKGQPPNDNSAQNVVVQLLRPGVAAPLAIKALKDAPPILPTMQQIPGFVLNKIQTPFAPLWSDRYEAVRPAASR